MAGDKRPSCEAELNRQIQLLSARIDQVENNVQSMYQVNEQLVTSLLADPLTATGVGPIAEAVYAAGEAGWAVMVELFNSIQLPSIKELTLQLAIEIAGAIINEVVAMVEQMIAKALAIINALLDQINGLIQTIAQLEQQLIDAVGQMRDQILKQIKAATVALEALKKSLEESNAGFTSLTEYLTAHLRVAGCKSSALTIG
jgi:hypothetical protein